MSEYFDEVEFALPKDPNEQPKPKLGAYNATLVKLAVVEIKTEIDRIRVGASDLTTYAINPGSFGFPAKTCLEAFEKKPADKTFKDFVQIAHQDFGKSAGDHFAALLAATRESD